MVAQANHMRIWSLLRDQFAHVKPVEEYLGDKAEFIYDEQWDPDFLVASRPDLVLCVNDYPYEIARCLDAAREAGIPSLVLQDGILEWRCQYENPLFGYGGGAPQHQPVLADKIACIGPQSARQIAVWGNAGKVEVTGMPRLDYLLRRNVVPVRRPGSRLLVMTAKNPGFTPEQARVTLKSLQDVKTYLDRDPEIDVIWRISKSLAPQLGVETQLQQFESLELSALMEQVDGVITTPSTAILEAMLLERPVAALDYHNVPRFVPTAWTISAPEHLPGVVTEILHPQGNKLKFQRDALEFCLACNSAAAPRVGELIEKMITFAKEAGGRGEKLSLPPNMIRYQEKSGSMPSLAELYPESIFAENEAHSLQIRHARLQKEHELLKKKLARRSLGYWIEAIMYRISEVTGRKRRGLK